MHSTNAKINRALELFTEINSGYADWQSTKPFEQTARVNNEKTIFEIGIKFKTEPPIIKWSLITGEILFNLRCALDHLVYYLAISDSGIDPPYKENKLMFPISESEIKFLDSTGRGQLTGLNEKHIEMIKSCQPFNFDSHDTHPLITLSELNNIDKHRYLQPAVFSVYSGRANISGLTPGIVDVSYNDAPLNMTDWIMYIQSPAPIREPEVSANFSFRLGLVGDQYKNQELLKIIKSCIDTVVDITKNFQAG